MASWFDEHSRDLRYHVSGICRSLVGMLDEDECEMTTVERIIDLANCIHDWLQELRWIIRGIIRSLLGLPAGTQEETTPEEVQRCIEIMRNLRQERQHLEAAKAGEGPQPWDHDWHLYQKDFSKEIIQLAKKTGWHHIQNLIEIFNWALASPQCQRALAWDLDRGEPDPNNPWSEPLSLMVSLYHPLRQASHELLREQAKGLRYPEEWAEALDQRLLSILKVGEKQKA